eukprot:Skav225673  [mRNA]  locus=scaffold1924:363586:364668:- [translate_table: standard]
MACDWKIILADMGLADELCQKIVATYSSAEMFRGCFHNEADLEKYGKALLLGMTPPLADGDTWGFHPAMGALRRVREKVRALAQSAPVAATDQCQAMLPFFPPVLGAAGARVCEADKEKLVAAFSKHYPGVVLHPEVMPSLGYLQLIHQQCQSKSFVWTPWKKILSTEASFELSIRRASHRKRDIAEVVAHAAGLCEEEWDQDLLNAPHKIQQLLTIRAHAYALCEAGHLYNWMGYVHRFMFHYSKKPGHGFRFLSSEEAETADKELMSEIFRMVHHENVSLDDALTSIVREDLLRHRLGHMPKLPKVFSSGSGHDKPVLKRRKEQPKESSKLKPCFAWKNDGICKVGDACKFAHNDTDE